MNSRVRIIFTDLDGTLLNSEREISHANLNCLNDLGEYNIVRVIATGRSLFSFQQLFPGSIPVDYLIFSTGAGVLDLNSRKLLYSSSLAREEILDISSYLMDQNVDFMVHHSVPDNHYFTYFATKRLNPDFQRRIDLYKAYAEKFSTTDNLPHSSSQIIAIFPPDLEWFNEVKKGINAYQVTRTTSPLDGESIWMEIFPKHVSKGYSAAWLCKHLEVSRRSTLGIGNDYNDISLLNYTNYSYLVANAPLELQRDFLTTRSNNEDGFYHVIKKTLAETR